ncbi:hypothetical protein DPMN_145212 [Dreissena polymorpha]|uniref:Uncharacterized protein n=1 Tax=Dreissena polymorpha TaxID=45954 RepID=A0A9D4F4I7_DREPO|nr:hypothetical protein DPMN_145212 [Dreissena polymorpha]
MQRVKEQHSGHFGNYVEFNRCYPECSVPVASNELEWRKLHLGPWGDEDVVRRSFVFP